MGGCESCATTRDDVLRAQHAAELDMQMDRDRNDDRNHFKILLLGAGESGKSTIIKQLSLLYRKGGIMEDRRQFIRVLQNNTIVSMQSLLTARATFNDGDVSLGDSQLDADAALIDAAEGNEAMTPEMADAVTRLWDSEPIQEVYRLRNRFWLLETADYYFLNCSRFVQPDFVPDDVDVIMARKRTTGVIVTEFPTADGLRFSVVDVGGQRSERRKWINCFDGVKAIFWVSNLSGYDRVLFEDKNINRMQEDLDLFKDTLKTAAFRDTPIFLFFNKEDLFREALQLSSIDACFPHYTGSSDEEECKRFIAEQFSDALPPPKKVESILYLSAKNKDDVRRTFEAVKDVLIERESAVNGTAGGSGSASSAQAKKSGTSSGNSSGSGGKASGSKTSGGSRRRH